MSFEILGIGTATPEHSIDQADAATMAEAFCRQSSAQRRVLSVLYRRTGVRTRHSIVLEGSTNGEPAGQSFYVPAVSDDDRGPSTGSRMRFYEKSAAPLGAAATIAALKDAGVSPADVTHLVTVSCSGFSAPGFDISLIHELDLSAKVARTHIGFMGCHAALNGLRVAKAFADADSSACVVVCAVELCSLHQQYGWKPDMIVANALFADGAAAVVGRRGRTRQPTNWYLTASGSVVIPHSEESMKWYIRDHGFEMTLSPKIPELIHQHLRPWLERWLAEHDLAIGDVGSWAVHPGGPKILNASAEAAGFDPALLMFSREILAEFGNMSSPTVLFILERLRRHCAIRPCVMLAFGPGLTVEAALIL